MIDNLADFEPRRWFAKLRAAPEKNGKDKEEASGLATLAAAETGEDEHGQAALGRARRACAGLGGRCADPLDRRAQRPRCRRRRHAGGGAAQARARRQGIWAGGRLSRAYLHACDTEAKLVCLSYLGLGNGPAQIRYLVRRLRRTLPEGTLIMVCFWADEGDTLSVKSLLENTEADAYATSLTEAVGLCVKAAKGELKSKLAVEDTAPADKSRRLQRLRPGPRPPPLRRSRDKMRLHPAPRPTSRSASLSVNHRAPLLEVVRGCSHWLIAVKEGTFIP